MPRTRPFALPSVLALAVALSGCGDSSTAPRDDTVHFPGEASTLQAAIDMARPGDTVLVADGTHTIDGPVTISDEKDGITLRGVTATARRGGESRPILSFAIDANTESAITVNGRDVHIEDLAIGGDFAIGIEVNGFDAAITGCRIDGGNQYSISCTNGLANALISRNILVGARLFGVHSVAGARPTIESNTIVDIGDCGIYSSGAQPACSRNIIVRSANWGIACFSSPNVTISCNDLWQNVTAPYNDECLSAVEGDLYEDPLFCDMENYTLQAESPCAPENAGKCGGMGASEVICAP